MHQYDHDKKLNLAKKMVASVEYVPYLNFDSVINKALSGNRSESMMVVNADSNITAMRACASIGRHLKLNAGDIETNMRTSGVVDFNEHGTIKEWKLIVKQYKLSTASRFIDDKSAVDKDEGRAGGAGGGDEDEEEDEEDEVEE